MIWPGSPHDTSGEIIENIFFRKNKCNVHDNYKDINPLSVMSEYINQDLPFKSRMSDLS